MRRIRDVVICGLLCWGSVWGAVLSAAPLAVAQAQGQNQARGTAPRRLTGRFLHVTDFHPDPFYKTYSSTERGAACHRKHGPAGLYGAETSACDSPYSLVNQTFKWIQDHIADDIDFVVWTGDSARHDNDEEIPRTQKQVIEQNEFLVTKFAQVFGRTDGHNTSTNAFRIPIVPTFGNNDIMPHNIFSKGPNRWTSKYLDIWHSMIPEAQRHQFQQGGWFSVEVIPGNLAVISLNTLYFFNSNSGVDGCADKHEPGYEHMEWLRIQLQLLRDRGMKAILMGHVPPARVNSKESWDETCWQKYTLWVRQFRDVIVGSLYGHMNIDHFMLQDFEQISKEAKRGKMGRSAASEKRSSSDARSESTLYDDGEISVASASDYLLDLRQAWADLSVPLNKSDQQGSSVVETKRNNKPYFDWIGGKLAERYAITFVAPSIVPNYYPTLRIIEYNITGLEDVEIPPVDVATDCFQSSEETTINDDAFLDDEEYLRTVETNLRKGRAKKGKKGRKKYKFKVPEGPSKSSPPGPAYSPQTFTFTRIVQYFANLTKINNDFVTPHRSLSSFHTSRFSASLKSQTANDLDPQAIFGLKLSPDGRLEDSRWKEGKHNKHQGKKPRQKPHPKDFKFEVEYDTQKDQGFTDLTVRRWVEFARKIGQSGSKSISVENYDAEANGHQYAERDDDDDFKDDVDDQEEYEPEHNENGKKMNKLQYKGQRVTKAWKTFVKRAFVGTMDHNEIEILFSTQPAVETSEQVQDNMEL